MYSVRRKADNKINMKSNYLFECKLDNDSLFILSLLTFDYEVLADDDVRLWNKSEFSEIKKYTALVNKKILLELEEEEQILTTFNSVINKKKKKAPHYVIYITDKCNQRCPYCFEGNEGVLRKIDSSMNKNQVDNILDFIHGMNGSDMESPQITLFGGEPLLEENKDLVEYTLRKLKEYDFTNNVIVTNGITLNTYYEILSRYESIVSGLVLTINGLGDLHDNIRGSKSFDKIIANIKEILEKDIKIDIQINILVSQDNICYLKNIIEYLRNINIYGHPRVSINVGRIQCRTNPDNPHYKRELPYKDFFSSMIHYYSTDIFDYEAVTIGSEMGFLADLIAHWKKNRIFVPSFSGCEAIYPGRLCFFLDGKIYPCTEVTGNNKYVVGDYNLGEFNQLYTTISSLDTSEYDKCKKCKYRLLCNGGCFVSGCEVNGKTGVPYCLDYETTLRNMVIELDREGFFDEFGKDK